MMSQREKANRAALNKLIKMGSDMERAHPFEFFLYFPGEWNAYTAAAHLLNLQFKVNVSFSEFPDTWLCLAIKEIKPSKSRILELSRCLEELAEENNGEFDGWGTRSSMKAIPKPDDSSLCTSEILCEALCY